MKRTRIEITIHPKDETLLTEMASSAGVSLNKFLTEMAECKAAENRQRAVEQTMEAVAA